MDWARILAYITGTVDQELLLRNEYLIGENRILKAQIKARLRLSDAERTTLAEIAHRLGRQGLKEVAAVAKPETILGWYRKLIANKFDGSKARRTHGRPRIDEEIERLVVRMAKENPNWGDRIVGALGQSRTPAVRPNGRQYPSSPQHPPAPSESTAPVGKISFALIWMFWLEPISSR
jgi:hypothetical protein